MSASFHDAFRRANLLVRALVVPAWLLMACVASAQTHKVRVSDPLVAKELVSQGGRMVADYGGFQIIETGQTTTGRVQNEDHFNSILLNARPLDTRRPEVRAQRQRVNFFQGRRLHLVQFSGPIKPEWREALEQHGARIVSYIPQNAYLIQGDTTAIAKVQSWAGTNGLVQWEGAYADNYKISSASAGEAGDYAVQLTEDADNNAATLALIDQLKLGPLKNQFRVLHYINIIVRLPSARLVDVAARPDVVSIQPYLGRRLFDERQDQIIAGNLTGGSPTGPSYLAWLTNKGFSQAQFTASGFAVDVTDSGIDNGTTTPGHFGLYQFGDPTQASRVIYNRIAGSPNSGSSLMGCDGHGNLNSHIIAGYNDSAAGFPHTDAAGFRYGLGVCPFVKVGSSVIFDPTNFTNPNFANLQSAAYRDGARISANSWGAPIAGAYDIEAQAYDALVRDAQPAGSTSASDGNQQMVIVFAAGNSGPGQQTIGTPGTAKNVITVGASESVRSMSSANGGNYNEGYDGSGVTDSGADNIGDIIGFSSRGPCVDGRMKPDLVAPGTHISGGVAQNSPSITTGNGSAISCFNAAGVSALIGGHTLGNPNNFFPLGQQFYTVSSGTSQATPSVAGACALLRQHFINHGAPPPSPAMTKAFLMNSTRYLTGVDANDTLWSSDQGMGGLDIGRALDGVPRVLRDQLTADKFTASGQVRVFTGRISDASKPFRITLAWTDAPGSTTGNAFNNDLDLTVTVGGNVYQGNVFSGAFSATGGTPDPANNVESVFIPAGLFGEFTVTITAANINSDGVSNEAPAIDQDFALVIYNAAQTIVGDGYAMAAEGFEPANEAIDPDEDVTVDFSLKNIGSADTTNLVATLLATNGIVPLGSPQAFGALVAGGVSVARPFSFSAAGTCGGSVTAVFQLSDGGADLGKVSFTLGLGKVTEASWSGTNSAQINIPGSGTKGKASSYPSTISITGVTGTVSKVTVALSGLAHTWPDDIDVLLVGPTGQTVMLMSDVGGGGSLSGVNLVFDDEGAALPGGAQIVSGTYKPTNFDIFSDAFVSPAPDGPFGGELALFNGTDPNGTWSLYVQDDDFVDTGRLLQGWSLSIMTANASCCTGIVLAADLAVSSSVSTSLVNLGSNLTFSVLVTNLGPDTATGVVITNMLPPGVAFVSGNASQGSLQCTGGVVMCATGPLTNGAFINITIEAESVTAGSWTNSVVVSSYVGDPVSGNNVTTMAFAVNAPPMISGLADAVTDEDVTAGPFAFTISDPETPASALTLSAVSSNPMLAAPANIFFGGSGTNRTVALAPSPGLSGNSIITIGVSDGLAVTNVSFTLTVRPINDIPTLAALADRTVIEGMLLAVTNSATDPDGPASVLTFSLKTNAPAGSAINATNGLFTWTPLESQGPGTNVISVIVMDDGGLSATQTFTVVVLETNSAPVLAMIPDQTVIEGVMLTVTNSTSDSDEPTNKFTYSLGTNAPVGATINSTNGLLTWIASEVQGPSTNVIRVIVADNGVPSLSVTQAFTVVVLESNSAPVLTAIADRTVFEGTLLTFTNVATDADVPTNGLLFSLATSAPAGAAINVTNGVFTWTPTEAQGPGTNLIRIIVTDDGVPSLSATQSFSVIVMETNSAPTLAAIPNRTVIEGQMLAVTNLASDPDLPANGLSFSLGTNAPFGASINVTNGVFTWTPTEAQGPGTNAITVIVTDDGGLSATQAFTVIVLETNSPPVLAVVADQTVIEGRLLVVTNAASDADIPANGLVFSLGASSPNGAGINSTSGVFTWMPTEAQGPATNVIRVIITDDGVPSLSATQTFTVVVLETNGPPSLMAVANQTVIEGITLMLTNVAVDADVPANKLAFSLATGAPAGAAINVTNGLFTWTPTEAQGPATNIITVIVTDDGVPSLSATQTFTVVVLETNSAPTLTTILDRTVFEETLLTFTNLAFDADVPANTLTFSLGTSVPAGAAINATSGVFTWSPTEAQGPATNTITVIVTDNGMPSLSATQKFSVVVLETNSPPVLAAISDQAVNEGELLVVTNVAVDPDVPANQLTFALGSGIPSGAAINPTNGLFTWIPTEAQGPGTNVIAVIVADSGVPSLSATQTFTVVVREINSPPVLGTVVPQTVVEGHSLVVTNTASDPDIPLNRLVFSLATNVPAGASINPTNGLFAWTPTETQGPATNVITMIVTDDGVPSLSVTQTFTVAVLETNIVPVLAPISDRTVIEGTLLTFTNVAVDADVPANSLIFSLGSNAPAGAGINATNGVFTWTPTEAQGPATNVITVIVTDDGLPSLSATQTFTVVVLETNSSPVLAAIADQMVFEGRLLVVTNSASDPDLPTNGLAFILGITAPPGASINATNGLFSWTPTEAQGPGTNIIRVILTDGGGLSATQTFTVVVLETNSPPGLAAIADQIVIEGHSLLVTNAASDPDIPVNGLTFSLGANAPAGAGINSTNGVFTWLPVESQGPGTNIIRVIVRDDGTPSLSATQSFMVVILETNSAPALMPVSDRMVIEGTLLTFTNVAFDADVPTNTLTFSLTSNAPAGAVVNATNGLFTWMPSELQGPGTHVISVIVTDDGVPSLSATQTFTVIVLESNSPPLLAAIQDQTVIEGCLLVMTDVASDSDIPSNGLIFSLGNGAPFGASINATNGLFVWTPTEAQGPGTNVVSVIVTDNGVPSLSATQTFTVIVLESNSPPLLAAIQDQNVIEGHLLVMTNAASDPDLPPNGLFFSLGGNSPAGVAINPTNGVITWLPNESQGPGTNVIAVIVRDDGIPSLSTTQTFTVVVLETNSAPVLMPVSNRTVIEGTLLTFTNAATDSDIPANTLTFSLATNAPAGAILNPTNGVFTWTPTEVQGPGTSMITVIVTDDGVPSLSATQTFTVIVLETNSAPTLTSIPDQAVIEGTLLVVTNQARDSDLPANGLVFSLASGAPAGAKINVTNGVFTWMPSEAQGPGTNTITVIVTDDGVPSLSATQMFTVVVLEMNSPPVLAVIADRTIHIGSTLSIQSTATDPDVPAAMLTFALLPDAPYGATINANSGLFEWTPDGNYLNTTNSITVRVTDDGLPPLVGSPGTELEFAL